MIYFFRRLIQFSFSAMTLLLLFVFMLRLFEPGTSDTAYLFQGLQRFQPWLDHCTNWCIIPLNKLLAVLSGLFFSGSIPSTLKAWFPIAPADRLMQMITALVLRLIPLSDSGIRLELTEMHYDRWFPGVIDWRLLLSLPLWGFVEALIYQFLNWIGRYSRNWGL